MAEFRIKFNVAMVLAVVLGEIASFLWYNNNSPWHGRAGERYLLTSIVCDAILVCLIKWIVENFYRVSKWQDAAILSMWLALVFACLQGPHVVWSAHTFSWFMFHALHKFILTFVMTAAMFYFRNY